MTLVGMSWPPGEMGSADKSCGYWTLAMTFLTLIILSMMKLNKQMIIMTMVVMIIIICCGVGLGVELGLDVRVVDGEFGDW